MGDSDLLRCAAVSKRYGSHQVLRAVSLSVARGECVGLLGANGSGKTTLFHLILGLTRPDGGSVSMLGHPRYDKDAALRVGVSFERPTFYEALSALENLKVHSLQVGLPSFPSEEVFSLMRMLGLDPFSKVPIRKYSTGMRQRVSLVMALYRPVDLIVLDEPTSGLDEASADQFRAALSQRVTAGAGVLLSSHVQEDVRILCDRVYRLEDGATEEEPHAVGGLVRDPNAPVMFVLNEVTPMILQVLAEFPHYVRVGPRSVILPGADVEKFSSRLHGLHVIPQSMREVNVDPTNQERP